MARKVRELPAAVEPSSAPPGEASEVGESIRRCVEELPEGVREAVFLYYYEGESVRAVARALGITRAAALKRLERGRAALRDKLWRELEETIREMLPSARDWTRKGRQLAILLLGGVATAWGVRPEVALAAGAGVASTAIGKVTTGGVLVSGQKLVIASLVAVALVLAAVLFLGSGFLPWGRGPGGEPLGRHRPPPVATAKRPLDQESAKAPPAASTQPVAADAGRGDLIPDIRGKVHTLEGAPIAGARLIALHVGEWHSILERSDRRIWRGEERDIAADLRRLFRQFATAGESLPRVESGPDGGFQFFGLAEGEHRILAAHEDYLATTDSLAAVSPGRTAGLDLALVEAQSLAGRVIHAGETARLEYRVP